MLTLPPQATCAHAAVCPTCQDATARAVAVLRAEAAGGPPCPLTARHLDVLRAIANGCTYEAIGRRLHVGRTTVHTHVRTMLRLVGVPSSAALVGAAVRNGWIE